jgi:hypothetical protein
LGGFIATEDNSLQLNGLFGAGDFCAQGAISLNTITDKME